MDAPPHNNNNRNNADATAAVPLPLMLPLSLPLSPLLTELDLTSAGLTTTLPDSLRPSLGSLHKLNLAHNALSTLPEWLDEAVHLRTLFLLGNAFESVPVVVGRLPSLFMLSFKSNRLTGTTGIPPGALPATLGWLILTDNALTGLPTDGTFGRLTRLRKCMLASNRLSALPSDIDKCEALELIRLSDNCLPARELDKLARLPRLAWIAYGGQQRLGQRVTAPEVSTRVDTIEGGALPFDSGLLTIGSLLGEGASGFVHRATFEGKEIALKVYKQASSDGRPIDEVEVAVSIPAHPSLPRILNVFAGENKLALAIELVENATVLGKTPSFDSCTRDVYGPTQTIKPERAVAIALRIAQAARHLHANKVMHGDLYAHNTLIHKTDEDDLSAILCDYGAAFSYAHMPADLTFPFEKIEMRAFGCLLEELARLARSDHLAALSKLCFVDDPLARPSFASIEQQLVDISK